MDPRLFVTFDLPCYACRYNLRGLAYEGLCPECGLAVAHTLPRVPLTISEGLNAWREAQRLKKFKPIADSAGVTIDGVQFVRDVMTLAVATAQQAGPRTSRHVSAAMVCEAAKERTQSYFNDRAEAVELLDEWGIRTSEDIGRVLYAMIAHGWTAADGEDQQSDFDGLFTLETLVGEME